MLERNLEKTTRQSITARSKLSLTWHLDPMAAQERSAI
jgi:hypothetical protein